jgi:hypothetical protein
MERAVLRFTGAVELVEDEKLPQRFLLDPTRREVFVGREGEICPSLVSRSVSPREPAN